MSTKSNDRPVLKDCITDRDRHYGQFYGLDALPVSSRAESPIADISAPPRLAVIGNCQAESLRIVLHSSGGMDSFRIPPIHEWTAADMPFVHHALSWANVLITQPVRDNYRGLPCGSNQLAKILQANSSSDESAPHVITYPVLRFSALNPTWAIVRSPLDTSLNPPLVPYHDLSFIAEIARLEQTRPADFAGILSLNVDFMRARELAHGTVVMSDTLRTVPLWHTVNHPDNRTLLILGQQVRNAIADCRPEWADLKDPKFELSAPADREMLGQLRQPVDLDAWRALRSETTGNQLFPENRTQWIHNGQTIPRTDIAAAHGEFYSEHPEFIQTALQRHAETLQLLGFGDSDPR